MNIAVKTKAKLIMKVVYAVFFILMERYAYAPLVEYICSCYQLPFYPVIIVFDLVMSILYFYLLRYFDEAEQFKWRFKWRYLVLIFTLFFVIMGINLFVSNYLTARVSSPQVLVNIVPPTQLDLVTVLISMCLMTPICEELLGRGILRLVSSKTVVFTWMFFFLHLSSLNSICLMGRRGLGRDSFDMGVWDSVLP